MRTGHGPRFVVSCCELHTHHLHVVVSARDDSWQIRAAARHQQVQCDPGVGEATKRVHDEIVADGRAQVEPDTGGEPRAKGFSMF